MKKINFLALFLLLLISPLVIASMTIETQSNLNGVGGTPFSFDCLGSCYEGGLSYMASYNTSIANSVIGEYGVAGTFYNSHVSKTFYDESWNVVFLDSKDNKIKVLEYTTQFDVVAETTISGTVQLYEEGVLFDYDGDGRDDFVFVVNDGGTYKLVYYSLSSTGVWSHATVKSGLNAEAYDTLITCGDFEGVASGYVSGEGRQCFGNFITSSSIISGYKVDGTQTISFTLATHGLNTEGSTIPEQLIIKDINNDGDLEFVVTGYATSGNIYVYSETGTLLFSYDTNTDNTLCNIGRMTGTSNEYIACFGDGASSGYSYLYLLDEAGNLLFSKTYSSLLDAVSFMPLFVDVYGGGTGKEVCTMKVLSADSKIHFICYDEVGTEIGDYTGTHTIADSTKWVKQNFVNFKYMEDMLWSGSTYYTIIPTPEGLLGIDFDSNEDGTDVNNLLSFTALVESSSMSSKTQYKIPSWADIDCDGQIDMIVSFCDSDNAPCETKTFLSSNGTITCAVGTPASNTVPEVYSMSTNTIGNSLCLGQTYHFQHFARDYECDKITSQWDMVGNGIVYYPYTWFGYKTTLSGTCGLYGGTAVFGQDINTNDFGVGSYNWTVWVKDNVDLSSTNNDTLSYTICSNTNTTCSCYAPNSNLTNITTITGNVTSVYYNGTNINISDDIQTSLEIRTKWCEDDNESLMCTYGGFLSDNAKIKSDADWMIVGLIFSLGCVLLGGYASKWNGMVMIGSLVLGLIIASGIGFFGTWIPILLGVLIIGGLGYFGFQKMQGGQ